ncbi:putative sorbitol dehydrogenase [Xylariaceae sp. FL0804]|nr:putative sorbitol dehydrogenase [Xylariaceae sp. FL0804]
MTANGEIPKEMKAIRYNKLRDFSLATVPVPEPKPHEILVKVKSCGVCGTDLHIHDGDFESRMPVITGHETCGVVAKLGADVTGFALGDRVTADNSELCGTCHYCRRGQLLHCENFLGHGVHLDGGFAEYAVYPAAKLFKFSRLSWADATLFEAASCAVHGLEWLAPRVGSTALLIGAGPTGLCLAQLLRGNGCQRVVVASRRGPKTELARRLLGCGDEVLELDRGADPAAQWAGLRRRHPYGFDVVVEASGDHGVAERALDLVAKGGKLMYYGVYRKDALVNVPPGKIFKDEITIMGSFSQMYCLGTSVNYLESGRIKVDGIVDKTFKLEQFAEALDAVRNKKCIKAAIVMD